MNERIKRLLAQAHSEAETLQDTNWIANRFAELIVRDITDAISLLGVSALEDGKLGINSLCNSIVELVKEDYGIIE
jgi:hypothetical protein